MLANCSAFYAATYASTIFIAGALALAAAQPTMAQIVPDSTLDNDSSLLTERGQVRGAIADLIDGGAIRGQNLFHSFQNFNIDSGQRVYFANPDAVSNIFSRITGRNPSNIFGTLGVDGPASLFLLNPNGIVFGATAQLDIEGSFMASTAERFTFADGSEFSATTPTDTSLLTVSVPLGLQYNDTPVGNVVNDGNLQIGANQSLTLFGDTVVHRGQLSTPGGTINLLGNQVALMETAQVDVSSPSGGGDVFIGGAFQGQPIVPTAQTTYVEPGVTINASATDAGNGGQIIVWADDATSFAGTAIARGGNISGDGGFVEISGQQFLDYRGQVNTQAVNGAIGSLLLDPTNIEIVADPGETLDLNQVNDFGIPDIGGDGTTQIGAGAISAAQSDVILQTTENITFGSTIVIAEEGVSLTAQARENISVLAPIVTNIGDITLIAGDPPSGIPSAIDSNNPLISVETSISSNGGDILFRSGGDITLDGAFVNSSAADDRGTGSLTLEATDQISLINGTTTGSFLIGGERDGGDMNLQANGVEINDSSVFSIVANEATGRGGDINVVATDRLLLRNNGSLNTATLSSGDAGDIVIEAGTIEAEGISDEGRPNRISSATGPDSTGDAGDIDVSVDQLLLRDGSAIFTSPQGTGDAGNINIEAGVIDLLGSTTAARSLTGIYTSSLFEGAGKAGDISLTVTDRLSVRDGATIASSTNVASDGGTLAINVGLLEVTGIVLLDETALPSSISSIAAFDATGDGGQIRINADRIVMSDSGAIEVDTFGPSNAGNIDIEANTIELTGQNPASTFPTEISSDVGKTSSGNGGNVTLNTQRLTLRDGAEISSSTGGEGDTGTLTIDADRIEVLGEGEDLSLILVQVTADGKGNGQSLSVNTNELLMAGGQIQAGTFGEGNGGDLIINANDIELIANNPADSPFTTGLFVTVEPEAMGNGGNLQITGADRLTLQDGAQILASVSGTGNAGTISIEAGVIELLGQDTDDSGSGIAASVSQNTSGEGAATGNAGTITLNAEQLLIRDGSFVSVTTDGTGEAGDLFLNVSNIQLSGSESGIRAASKTDFPAGTITIRPTPGQQDVAIAFQDDTTISAETSGNQPGGNIEISAPDSITLSGEGSISVQSTGEGNAGSLSLTTYQLTLADGVDVTVSSEGSSGAGNLTVEAQTVTLENRAQLTAETEAGQGGNIDLDIGNSLSLSNNSQISASTVDGVGGTLTINEPQTPVQSIALSQGSTLRTEATDNGDSGDILINTEQFSLDDSSVTASTISGTGGTITFQELDRLELNQGSVSTTTQDGQGGTVSINRDRPPAQTITLREDSTLQTAATGTGDSGDIFINAEQLALDESSISASTLAGIGGTVRLTELNDIQLSQSTLTTTTQDGAGGDINIDTSKLGVVDGSQIDASTSGRGNAGNITIAADDQITIRGPQSALATTTSGAGDAGNLSLSTARFTVRDQGRITASTSGTGRPGDIAIEVSDRLALINQGIISTALEPGAAVSTAIDLTAQETEQTGQITIQTPVLSLTENSRITASTSGIGNAGTITIRDADTVILDDSRITTAIRGGAVATEPSRIRIGTRSLLLTNDSNITARTAGTGDAGTITIPDADEITLSNSRITTTVAPQGVGQGGRIRLNTDRLALSDRARISSSTAGQGSAGSITILDAKSVSLDNSQISTTVGQNAIASTPGAITINTQILELTNGTSITASTDGEGGAGQINLQVSGDAHLANSRIASEVGEQANGEGGDIVLSAGNLELRDRAQISSSSQRAFTPLNPPLPRRETRSVTPLNPPFRRGEPSILGNAGNIQIEVGDRLRLDNSDITTQANAFAGGEVTISASAIRLVGDSDIQTSVQSGTEGGGDIQLTADLILASDDSDILAFAQDGTGGNITLNTPAFFGENFNPERSNREDLATLDGNDRVDINATGVVNGIISLPDVSFIQNSLNALPESLIDTEALIAHSCIVRHPNGSTFIVTGAEGLGDRPGQTPITTYPTGDIQSISIHRLDYSGETESVASWTPGDPIIEAQDIYQLPNGDLIMSHACSTTTR